MRSARAFITVWWNPSAGYRSDRVRLEQEWGFSMVTSDGILYEDNSRIAEWCHVSTAPFDRDLELAVLDWEGSHALIFPCRRIIGGWLDAETKEQIDVDPTHWRSWGQVS